MKVNPSEVASAGLLPEGEYVARIADAADKVSGNGNDMWEITWVVTTGEFKDAEVRDWVTPAFASKFVPFWTNVLGLPLNDQVEEVATGTLPGKRAELVVRHTPRKDGDGVWASVESYRPAPGSDIPAEEDPIAVGANGAQAVADEDIPF